VEGLDNNEFILSKLDTAIGRARSIELISFSTTVTLGFASLSVALATVAPISDLGLIRALLLASAAGAVVLLYFLLGRLMHNRRARLNVLRKWQTEAFLKRGRVNSLSDDSLERLIELVQAMEDASLSRRHRYGQFDEEYRKILNG
jgi:hypothetical protein